MGKHLLIVGFSGTHCPQLTQEIIKLLSDKGLQVQHASLQHKGQTAFATGGPTDLQEDLAAAGLKIEVVEAAEGPTGAITLETVNANVLEVKTILERFEKKSDKGAKAPKPEKKGPPEIINQPAGTPPIETPKSEPQAGDPGVQPPTEQEQAPDSDPNAQQPGNQPAEEPQA